MSKYLYVSKVVRVEPHPKWYQFWKPTHERKLVGKVKLEPKEQK